MLLKVLAVLAFFIAPILFLGLKRSGSDIGQMLKKMKEKSEAQRVSATTAQDRSAAPAASANEENPELGAQMADQASP
jgi:hypothetical protein